MINKSFLEELKKNGVEEVVACPGGRCAALLNQFIDDNEFKVETFYDERSAGFYALGRSIKTQTPVVLLTTSGSAVANVYPSLLEAKYKEDGKLIYISADRPLEFDKTGAPQTITQNDIFKSNDIKTLTLQDSDTEFDLSNLVYPVHINIHSKDPNSLRDRPVEVVCGSLIIVSTLRKNEIKEVTKALKNYEGALVLESLSNLREEDFPKATIIKYADSFLNKMRINAFKKIYRIGGVPVLKSWREAHKHPEVFYWDKYDYPGAVGSKYLSLQEIVSDTTEVRAPEGFTETVKRYAENINELADEFKASEVSRFRALSKLIPSSSKVFLGNSMPIRYWEFVDKKDCYSVGQRGVNGIDGSLALFLGQLDENCENWIVLGDLTTLYNLNDFQVIKKLKGYKIRIVVVNNSGGRIFEKIFSKNKEHFINEQNISFSRVASLWGVKYAEKGSDIEEADHIMCELVVDPKESVKFWKKCEEIIL